MNIIFPINGLGVRFKEDGYITPKPLINVLGTPMFINVLKSLTFNSNDNIYIIYNNLLEDYRFKDIILKHCHYLNIKFIIINKTTNGAVETLEYGLNFIDNNEKTIVIDCDTIYKEDILKKYRTTKNGNIIFYFKSLNIKPLFSYISLNKKNEVLAIKEKVKISNNANTGAYGFENIDVLKHYCTKLLSMKIETEYYVSLLYQLMIDNGIKINGVPMKLVDFLGTPEQLETFIYKNKQIGLKRVCFDLDNTLVTYPKIKDDYTTVEPIQRNIDYLNYLKECGNVIIIYTARRMKTHNGSVGKVVSDIGKITLDTLSKLNINYDEIYFGKPYADFYIDDLAVNCFLDIEKELGIYENQIKPRMFNKIIKKNNLITKITSNDGECFYYKNIPKSLIEFFAETHEINGNTIVMNEIIGNTFSHLLIKQKIDKFLLYKLLDKISEIHKFKTTESINIYQNYYNKIKIRYDENIDFYNKFDDYINIKNEIFKEIGDYEKNNGGVLGMIHGDPVFSNIILTESKEIKFIDMRGKIGNQLTIYGDIFYDYGKILQCLYGYDFILNNKEIDYKYLLKLRIYFEEYFETKFKDKIKDVKIITKTLIFSMLPLHIDNMVKVYKYYDIIKKIQ